MCEVGTGIRTLSLRMSHCGVVLNSPSFPFIMLVVKSVSFFKALKKGLFNGLADLETGDLVEISSCLYRNSN